jgi:hypothetical protein
MPTPTDIYGRLSELKLVMHSMTLTRIRERYDSIDRDITRAMLLRLQVQLPTYRELYDSYPTTYGREGMQVL